MGEFIALTIGTLSHFAGYRVIAANAHNPLSDNSRADLDLLWLFFGPTANEDIGVVQEVKTTSDPKLGYANNLIEDYAKLFATDPQFTLQSRFAVAANKMEGMGLASDLCCRTRVLGGISAATSPKIQLYPTLVHEKQNTQPIPKLTAVKSTIVATCGWPATAVHCSSISLDQLEARLARLTWGQP